MFLVFFLIHILYFFLIIILKLVYRKPFLNDLENHVILNLQTPFIMIWITIMF